MPSSALEAEIRCALQDAPFELAAAGLYCHRTRVPAASLVAAEAALARSGAVRVLDFTHGEHLLAENVLPREDADPADYEGVEGPSGHRIFRVDHHYDLGALAAVSTTPLVIAWIRGLWRRGRHELLRTVARSRYLADHADADMLLANFFAGQADHGELVHGPLGAWAAAAALRNDYVVSPAADLEPQASQIFHACVGLEEAIRDGRLRFADVQARYLPGLLPWLERDGSKLDPAVGFELDRLAAEMRADEARTLERIAAWECQGKLTRDLDGRLAILEADEKINNATFFLYLVRRDPPVVQLLFYPEPNADPGRVVVKIRSHGDFELFSLFGKLTAAAPEGRFAGRRTAGGSRPIDRQALPAVLARVRDHLGARS